MSGTVHSFKMTKTEIFSIQKNITIVKTVHPCYIWSHKRASTLNSFVSQTGIPFNHSSPTSSGMTHIKPLTYFQYILLKPSSNIDIESPYFTTRSAFWPIYFWLKILHRLHVTLAVTLQSSNAWHFPYDLVSLTNTRIPVTLAMTEKASVAWPI